MCTLNILMKIIFYFYRSLLQESSDLLNRNTRTHRFYNKLPIGSALDHQQGEGDHQNKHLRSLLSSFSHSASKIFEHNAIKNNKLENDYKNDKERKPSLLANYENIHVWGKASSHLCTEKQSQISYQSINKTNELVTKQKMKYVPNNTSDYYSKFRNGDQEFEEQATMSNDKKRRCIDPHLNLDCKNYTNLISHYSLSMPDERSMGHIDTKHSQGNHNDKASTENTICRSERLQQADHHQNTVNGLLNRPRSMCEENGENAKFEDTKKENLKGSWMATKDKRRSPDKNEIKVNFDGEPSESGSAFSPKRKKLNSNAYLYYSKYKEEYRDKECKRQDRGDGTYVERNGSLVDNGKRYSRSSREYNHDNLSSNKHSSTTHVQPNGNPYHQQSICSPKVPEEEIEILLDNYKNDSSQVLYTSQCIPLEPKRFSTTSEPANESNFVSCSKEVTRKCSNENYPPFITTKDQLVCTHGVKNNAAIIRSINDANDCDDTNQYVTEDNQHLIDSQIDVKKLSATKKSEMELRLLYIGENHKNGAANTNFSNAQPTQILTTNHNMQAACGQGNPHFIAYSSPTYQYDTQQRVYHPSSGHLMTINQTDIQSPLGSPNSYPAIGPANPPTTYSIHPTATPNSHHGIAFISQENQNTVSSTISQHQPSSSNPNSLNSTFLSSVPNVSPISQTCSPVDSGYGGPGSVGSLPSSTYSSADSPVSYGHNNGMNSINLAGFPNSPWQASDFSIPPSSTLPTSSISQTIPDIQTVPLNTRRKFLGSQSHDISIEESFLPVEYSNMHCNNVSNGIFHGQNDYVNLYNDNSSEVCKNQSLDLNEENPHMLHNTLNIEYIMAHSDRNTAASDSNLTYNFSNNDNENNTTTMSSTHLQILSKSSTSQANLDQASDNRYLSTEQDDPAGKMIGQYQVPAYVSMDDKSATVGNVNSAMSNGCSGPATSVQCYEKEGFDSPNNANDEVQNLHDSDIQTIVDSLYREGLVEMDEPSDLAFPSINNTTKSSTSEASGEESDEVLPHNNIMGCNIVESKHINSDEKCQRYQYTTTIETESTSNSSKMGPGCRKLVNLKNDTHEKKENVSRSLHTKVEDSKQKPSNSSRYEYKPGSSIGPLTTHTACMPQSAVEASKECLKR